MRCVWGVGVGRCIKGGVCTCSGPLSVVANNSRVPWLCISVPSSVACAACASSCVVWCFVVTNEMLLS